MTPALSPLEPFGAELIVPAGTTFGQLDVAHLEACIAEHRLVVIRGLEALDKPALPAAARRLGPLQAWSFGSVHELVPDADADNYLYTRREVPLHWDGAFAGRVPHHLFFQCLEAPGPDAGGATTFVDTTRIWAKADAVTRDRWRALRFTYETDQVAHYGGRFSQTLVASHPSSGEAVLRYAEPVDDLNPVRVDAEGLGPMESAATVTEMRAVFDDASARYEHEWRAGDVVIADNHALLHGRRAFESDAPRHIRRVNVHDRDRSWRDDVLDSIRIRRPEFMVAEIPILVIAALLATGSFSALFTGRFAWLTVLFFLLFHFGDMINCLADRDLDAVYKTRLSEAVYGLGVSNVRWQLGLTVAAALSLGAAFAVDRAEPRLLGLVSAGLALGAQYSMRPLWLKGRGLLQIGALWALIFFGPMTLVAMTMGDALETRWLVFFACYGAMQQGIVLVNTAEDLPEDEEAGIGTSARALGLRGSALVALTMTALGGLGVVLVLASEGARSSLVPLVIAWALVVGGLARLSGRLRGLEPDEALVTLRSSARGVPVAIAVTAWGALATVAWHTATI